MRIIFLFILLGFSSLSGESHPSYVSASKELVIAWERLYPLPFSKILKQDPLKNGVHLEKRKDKRKVWVYNFNVFMTKYDRNNNDPTAREEGREILLFFLWEPDAAETPYRIQLGELVENI